MQTNLDSLEEITMQIDTDAAEVYNSANPDEKRKIQILFSAWLKEFTAKDQSSLKQLMDEISENARARGLTPEILEAILSE